MSSRTSDRRPVLMTVLAAGALALAARVLPAQQGPAPPQPDESAWARRMDLTSDLILNLDLHLRDAPRLAGRALALSAGQAERLGALAAEQQAEADRLLRQLNAAYADRVRELLSDEQVQLFDGIVGALERLEGETAEAHADLLEGAGLQSLPPGVSDRLAAGALEPPDLLDLPSDKRAELQRLRDEMDEALFEALQHRIEPGEADDPAAWRERRKQFREAQRQARERFEAARDALLSPAEGEKLALIEEALPAYAERVSSARREATLALLGLLAEPARERVGTGGPPSPAGAGTEGPAAP